MEKKKIIVSERIADEGVAILREKAEVDFRDGISREELLSIIDQYDALIVRSITQVNEELIQRATRLKVVGRAGNGIDNIDVEACTRYGIIVANTPDSNTISAAEQTISLLLSSVRNTAWANDVLKGGTWDRKPFRGTELYGKTVGIVGLGRIGSMVATRLKAFNMKVIAYDPYISDERFEKYGAEKKETLEELAREADIITVHTPRTEETTHIIDEKVLSYAKEGVMLVNCARGGIMKEAALLEGLKSGKVRSVGLDVYEKNRPSATPCLILIGWSAPRIWEPIPLRPRNVSAKPLPNKCCWHLKEVSFPIWLTCLPCSAMISTICALISAWQRRWAKSTINCIKARSAE